MYSEFDEELVQHLVTPNAQVPYISTEATVFNEASNLDYPRKPIAKTKPQHRRANSWHGIQQLTLGARNSMDRKTLLFLKLESICVRVLKTSFILSHDCIVDAHTASTNYAMPFVAKFEKMEHVCALRTPLRILEYFQTKRR